MATVLSKTHRKLLENTTAEARIRAEKACRAALENLAVHEREYRAHMGVEQRLLRNRLRARGRALGDHRDARTGVQEIKHLTELAAYEHWHRLLFTRFLTENNLLYTDEANSHVPVTLEECEELASSLGARDGLELACRFGSRTLPGVFRRDDPVLDLPIAINDQVELRQLLNTLPPECFRADDALGWTYQFWQAQRKDEVNASGKKIGADELAPVTQLFTEDYMVEFLLHNTLGAWWAGKHGPIRAATEQEARAQVALVPSDGVPAIAWSYLRFVRNETSQTWLPAADTFEAWPKMASLIRLLDPCMGSGHFLVFALPLLVRLRMEEEKLTAPAAVVAVLQDNLHGLELDERCTQIAAFNVALTAWKLAGYQVLPNLHLACSGLAPIATEAEWVTLAGRNDRLQRGMARLHDLFKDAPVLGSLINPSALIGNLVDADFREVAPLLTAALESGESQEAKFESDAVELAVIAQGLTKAAELLASQFTLVVTNVPYLGRGKQVEVLQDYCERVHPEAKADLATCFIERCLDFCADGGSAALVTPQNWLFLTTYTRFRELLLRQRQWNILARLGPKGFQTPMWDFNVQLGIISATTPELAHTMIGLDASDQRDGEAKAAFLRASDVTLLAQADQALNPDSRIVFGSRGNSTLLVKYSESVKGLTTGDGARFIQYFWEQNVLLLGWDWFQTTVVETIDFGGSEQIFHWENGNGEMQKVPGARTYARGAWGTIGVLISQMGKLPATRYFGCGYDNNCAVIKPKNAKDLPALWAYCSSPNFAEQVRRIDQSLKPTNAAFEKIPFDLAYWQAVAIENYPNGLPKPHSDDPTQWLFNGHPAGSAQPLHVSVARLLGYQWPRQTGSSFPDCPAIDPDGLDVFADHDGIVCLPPLNREQHAAARLRQVLAVALGSVDERALIAAAGLKGSKSQTLEDWLRDEFFEQHSKLFHDRPFIWHLWDGLRDGFHALVNYHKLEYATLQKLTYSYLGDWIRQQDEDAKADKPGAAERLGAARALQTKLAAILEGETPLDIFVRWKAIKEQPQGWHPDLNDGIRQNIRPFLLAGDVGKKGAGLFRVVPLVLKENDRGSEPDRPRDQFPWFWCENAPGTDPVGGKGFVGTRWNNVHLTLARKKQVGA